MRKLILEEGERRLNAVGRVMKSLGVRPETRLLLGDPLMEIIRDVIENHRDLVAMTAERKVDIRQRIFGTTSTRMMRKCPTPILIVKPSRKRPFQQILAAIDPEVIGEARDTLNGTILQLASSLAAREEATLHVVHAWSVFGEQLIRSRGGKFARDMDREVQEEAKRRREMVDKLLASHEVAGCRIHLPRGDTSDVICRLATTLNIDLLVMGTVCRTGIPGFVIGNTAERLLSTVDCSVLTVKPEGFVSPVAADICQMTRAYPNTDPVLRRRMRDTVVISGSIFPSIAKL